MLLPLTDDTPLAEAPGEREAEADADDEGDAEADACVSLVCHCLYASEPAAGSASRSSSANSPSVLAVSSD